MPAEIKEIGELYASIMTEVKFRVDFILSTLNGTWAMARVAAFEFCYLQLRKICELIALACVVAHGDIARNVRREYHAGVIMSRLGALRPDFYPVPSTQRLDQTTGQPVEIIKVEDGFLSKEDLLQLYGECGRFLHRNSVKRVRDGFKPDLDFERVRLWVDKIIALLSQHSIQAGDPNVLFVVMMNEKQSGNVLFFPMLKTEP